jgi:undecaprenyl-diphosphatase
VESLVYYVLLGVLQGVTEFLPISSSGHLVAAQALLSVRSPGIILEVSLHFGTLVAILIVFRREVWEIIRDTCHGCWLVAKGNGHSTAVETNPRLPLGVAIVVGTVPAGVTGLLVRDAIEGLFHSDVRLTGIFLLITGILLLASRCAPDGKIRRVGPARGLLVGIAQACALLPGISRSGSTIVVGYYLGIERSAAARFSFLLAIPALAGAMVLETARLVQRAGAGSVAIDNPGALVVGTGTAALVGWLCLVVLLRVVKGGKLHWFAAYCIPAGLGLILYGTLAGSSMP